MKSDLPIIDLGPLRTLPNPNQSVEGIDDDIGTSFELDPEQKEVATQIHSACRTHGFFYISNHGIDPSLVQRTFQSTRQFFSLPSCEKSKLSSKNSPLFRGYISTSDGLHTCNSKKKAEVGLDQKESFTIGAVGEGPMRGDNQWPENENEGEGDCKGEGEGEVEDEEDSEKSQSQQFRFREVLEEYWEAQIVLCRVIARGLALSLGLNPYFFDCHLTSPVAQMVLLSYPPPPKSASSCAEEKVCRTKHTGCGEHTDCGFLTILAQDSPGLEVEDPHTKEWNLVDPIDGMNMFVVNLGDMAARWTNDAYKSTKHRVYNQNDRVRYSIPFFCNCDFDAPVECILTKNNSNLLSNESNELDDAYRAEKKVEVAKYEPTTAGAYIMQRLGFMRKK